MRATSDGHNIIYNIYFCYTFWYQNILKSISLEEFHKKIYTIPEKNPSYTKPLLLNSIENI